MNLKPSLFFQHISWVNKIFHLSYKPVQGLFYVLLKSKLIFQKVNYCHPY